MLGDLVLTTLSMKSGAAALPYSVFRSGASLHAKHHLIIVTVCCISNRLKAMYTN